MQGPKDARDLLRSGAFAGLRDSVRSLGLYATERGAGKEAGAKLVNDFFAELEGLDFELFQAARAGEPAGDAAKKRLEDAIAALDR